MEDQFCAETLAQQKITAKARELKELRRQKGKGKGSIASSDAAAAGGAAKRQRGVSDYARQIFEAALFDRYGGKTWTRCLLACGNIDNIHIAAVNAEIKRRIRDNENRDIDEADGRKVDFESMRKRKLPKIESTPETDWWGGIVWPDTQLPATFAHAAMKAYTAHYRRDEW